MQPNNYGSLVPQPVPQSAQYQYQQAAEPTVPKHHNKLLPVVIFLSVAVVGLLTFIIVDKLTPKKTVDAATADKVTSEIFKSLSSLDIPEDDTYSERIAQALAGRLFAINAKSDQTISFTSQTEYELTYYRNPDTDWRNTISSKKYGNYTVNGKTITLDTGDEFAIRGDYLVKTKDRITKTEGIVYFDVYQLGQTVTGINTSIKEYFNKWRQKDKKAPLVTKAHVTATAMTCYEDTNLLATADNYLCKAIYSVYFDIKDVDKNHLFEGSKYTDFYNLCLNDPAFSEYKNGGGLGCLGDYYAHNNAIITVRIKDDKYIISGLKHNADYIRGE